MANSVWTFRVSYAGNRRRAVLNAIGIAAWILLLSIDGGTGAGILFASFCLTAVLSYHFHNRLWAFILAPAFTAAIGAQILPEPEMEIPLRMFCVAVMLNIFPGSLVLALAGAGNEERVTPIDPAVPNEIPPTDVIQGPVAIPHPAVPGADEVPVDDRLSIAWLVRVIWSGSAPKIPVLTALWKGFLCLLGGWWIFWLVWTLLVCRGNNCIENTRELERCGVMLGSGLTLGIGIWKFFEWVHRKRFGDSAH